MEIDAKAVLGTIESLLLNAGVYDVDAYGWKNQNDVDLDFAGYAQWTLDPPYDVYAMPAECPNRAATVREERLMALGSEFFGVMKASRYAIGSALLHQGDLDPWDVTPHPFEFNEISALVSLSIASDRLRDFVIVTFLDEQPRFGHEVDQLRLALCIARQHGLEEEVLKLQALVPSVQALKRDRNATVHRTALREAKVQKQWIEEGRRNRGKRPSQRALSHAEMISAAQKTEALLRQDIQTRVSKLVDSYTTLVRSGDIAFRLEYDFRKLRTRKP